MKKEDLKNVAEVFSSDEQILFLKENGTILKIYPTVDMNGVPVIYTENIVPNAFKFEQGVAETKNQIVKELDRLNSYGIELRAKLDELG